MDTNITLESGQEASYDVIVDLHADNNVPCSVILSESNNSNGTSSDNSIQPAVVHSYNAIQAPVALPNFTSLYSPWRPTTKLSQIIASLHTDHYLQFPCLACVFCGRLLYPEKAKWTPYDASTLYPINHAYPNYQPQLHSQLPPRVPCCPLCVSPSARLAFPQLADIPQVIHNVPYHKRKYLSPIFLQSSLGRTVGGNPYTNYRHIVGTMGYSRNIRCLTLYSGMIGAFLQAHRNGEVNDNWYDASLLPAAQWLRDNNPYLVSYASILDRYVDTNNLSHMTEPVWPFAEHAAENSPPVNYGDVIVPNYDFPEEVHNEDAHYSRLMVGFLQMQNHNNVPISFAHPDLETLLFPDLFPDGHGHFKDNGLTPAGHNSITHETYGKYIKNRLQGIDSRFRLHPTWPVWSYLQLEKLRNYQNSARLLRTKQAERTSLPQTAADLLRESLYTNQQIVDEDQTVPLPTFIRTGDSYFREKQYHLDTMVSQFGLPTLFITLSMAESKWTQLHDILAATDNGDTLPSNRPFHTTLHFTHRLRMLKTHVWKNKAVIDWGEIQHFFERIEFQNRGAAHMHGCYWTSIEKSALLSDNVIRSDLPDPQHEPELYHAVVAHQIHSCKPALCGGPAPTGQRCRKGFPRLFSTTTHEDPNSLRYIYKCCRPEDQYVVPYHPATLIAWKAHINVQYVSTRGFAHYMVKYINKPEPSHVFNVYEGDRFQQHVIARRLGAMEVMFLTLGESICDSSTTVMYLTSEPPESRPKAIKPAYLLQHDDEHPFWDDTITKYFARPCNSLFNDLTYKDYYMHYSITKPSSTRAAEVWYDSLGNQVIARKSSILVRYRHMHISHGEPYFYQLLLHNHAWRSENELYGGYTTYRDHYFALHPDQRELMHNETATYLAQCEAQNFSQFQDLLDTFCMRLALTPVPAVHDVISRQMSALYKTPPIVPPNAMAELPPDQFTALNTLINKLGQSGRDKYPYYFLTGAAGTGKSYVLNLFVQHLQRTHKQYILLAPTGVAANNVEGHTIHSALRICQRDNQYITLALHNAELQHELKSVQVILIDEISMVAANLLDFISETFAKIHKNNIAFGGIPVVVVGDLCQLPPVSGPQVFHAAVWPIFHPIFLTHSHRQSSDPTFFKLLNEVRTGTIQPETWEILYNRHKETIQAHKDATHVLTTTHLVGMRKCASSINTTICNTLPTSEDQFLLATSHDVIRNDRWEGDSAEKLFKNKTNLPNVVRLQPGARVMLLNNSYFDQGLCNGSIGFVTHIDLEHSLVHTAFHVTRNNTSQIIHLSIPRTTQTFFLDGAHASRTQFPLQNCFALTVHKAQSLTLPSINVFLNKQFFTPGHAYVALSRASKWSDVQIADLDPAAFQVDYSVLAEYARLSEVHRKLQQFITH
jgi:hypothetical protein